MPYPLLALLVVALVATMFLDRGAAAARTPTPTPTATATPLPPGTLRIVVFNDLNGDGLLDPGEPGLASWHISQGCGDALRLLVTDERGEATTEFYGGYEICLHLNREFGWLPTRNNVHTRVMPDRSTDEPFLFGLHDLGRTAMELRGEAIAGGLPMEQGEPGIEAPFHACGHLFFERVDPSTTNTVVIVEGADTLAGCPRPGDPVLPSVDAPQTPSPSVPFAPGTTVTTSWVDNGDSMRFYASYVSDAWVLDPGTASVAKHCTEIRDVRGGLLPPGLARVFVVSEQARPGCGAPGRTVRLFRDGQPLDPILEWRAGDVSQTLPDFELAPTTVSFPDTGSAGAHGTQRHREVAALTAAAAFAIGAPSLAAAAAACCWQGRRRSVSRP